MRQLIDESKNNGVEVKKLYGDSIYSNFGETEKRKDEKEKKEAKDLYEDQYKAISQVPES